MPINKHAMIRYQALDKCFSRRGPGADFTELEQACNDALHEFTGKGGISRSQLFADIRFMQSDQGWSIPLEKNKQGKMVRYRYTDTDFSINKRPMRPEEAEQLREALFTISRFKGMPQFEWVDELSARLEASFHLKPGAAQVIEFEENPYLAGREHLTTLFHAILEERVLQVTYQSFKQERPGTVRFHPYYLKQYNNRWFVFGWNEASEGITNFALDRIHALRPAKGSYRTNETIDFTDYFEDVVGVTVPPGPPETVELRVNPKLWPYMETKPLHGSQKVVARSKEGVTVQLQVKLNYELEALLLSFGEGVEVTKPEGLRSVMQRRCEKLQGLYNQQQ